MFADVSVCTTGKRKIKIEPIVAAPVVYNGWTLRHWQPV
jgi:hypothetical protein